MRGVYPDRRGCICKRAALINGAGVRVINRVMMTSKASWSLLSVVIGALALTACKKDGDPKPPADDGGGAAADQDDGDGGGGDAEDEGPAFLTVDGFEETLQSKGGDVSDCFVKAKEAKPDLGGKLALDFTVGGDGVVSEVKTQDISDIKDDGLNACVLEKAKGWKFPKTKKGDPMTLGYTFTLN